MTDQPPQNATPMAPPPVTVDVPTAEDSRDVLKPVPPPDFPVDPGTLDGAQAAPDAPQGASNG